ncbi:MAG: hypothetical protein OER90_09860 [Gemmatimonadota bacterium]|nr:hypothetical protein [Gemmatimonadota bacterium]
MSEPPALHFGPDSLDSDFLFRRRRARALETYHLLSHDARDLYEGCGDVMTCWARGRYALQLCFAAGARDERWKVWRCPTWWVCGGV